LYFGSHQAHLLPKTPFPYGNGSAVNPDVKFGVEISVENPLFAGGQVTVKIVFPLFIMPEHRNAGAGQFEAGSIALPNRPRGSPLMKFIT